MSVTGWIAAMAAGLLPAFAAAEPDMVVVGDLHGDHGAFEEVLEEAGLVNARGRWSGGDAVLVQLGDIADRGPDSREIYRDLARLKRQARRAGGEVHVLLGNHEAMNVVGDLRYVHPGEYEAFRTRRSGRLRERLLDAQKAEILERGRTERPEASEEEILADWNRAHPLGFVEHRLAWAPDGEIGEFVTGLPAMAVIGDTLFVHGGILLDGEAPSKEEVNAAVTDALERSDASQDSILYDPEGPLWYRGLAMHDCTEERANIDRIKTAFGVERVVVAHTPTGGVIVPRCGGDVILADVGLSEVYGGYRAWTVRKDGTWYAGGPGGLMPLGLDDPGERASYLEWAGTRSERAAAFAAAAETALQETEE